MSKRFTCLRLNVYPVMLVAALLCVALAGCSATPVTQTAPGDLCDVLYQVSTLRPDGGSL